MKGRDASTSGRLGVLDASECPPTFGTHPELVVGLIAGGQAALTEAVEGAEDNRDGGAAEIAELAVNENDSVIGIAASGHTPYAMGGLQEANKRSALTVSIACNRPSPLEKLAEIGIALLVGAEVVSGSTRLRAGTAQKMVLNMISTAVMIRLGKTYSNLARRADSVAIAILEEASRELARAIAAVCPRLGTSTVPLVITGGTILHGRYLKQAFNRACQTQRLAFTTVHYVAEPAEGALKMVSTLSLG
jgi:N-acetylmuramic acid 6-phosphate etherase